MRSNVWQQLNWMQLFMLVHCPSHFILDVKSKFRAIILIKQNKAGGTVYYHF